jgi:hypothetical protein
VVDRGYKGGFRDVRYSCRKRGCQSRTKETTGTISQSHLIVYKKNWKELLLWTHVAAVAEKEDDDITVGHQGVPNKA